MPAYKDNNTQTWYASFIIKIGKAKESKMKRGFLN